MKKRFMTKRAVASLGAMMLMSSPVTYVLNIHEVSIESETEWAGY